MNYRQPWERAGAARLELGPGTGSVGRAAVLEKQLVTRQVLRMNRRRDMSTHQESV